MIQIQLYVGRGEETRVAYKVLVEKPEGKSPLGRPRSRREDNINWIFKKWDGRHILDLSDSK